MSLSAQTPGSDSDDDNMPPPLPQRRRLVRSFNTRQIDELRGYLETGNFNALIDMFREHKRDEYFNSLTHFKNLIEFGLLSPAGQTRAENWYNNPVGEYMGEGGEKRYKTIRKPKRKSTRCKCKCRTGKRRKSTRNIEKL